MSRMWSEAFTNKLVIFVIITSINVLSFWIPYLIFSKEFNTQVSVLFATIIFYLVDAIAHFFLIRFFLGYQQLEALAQNLHKKRITTPNKEVTFITLSKSEKLNKYFKVILRKKESEDWHRGYNYQQRIMAILACILLIAIYLFVDDQIQEKNSNLTVVDISMFPLVIGYALIWIQNLKLAKANETVLK